MANESNWLDPEKVARWLDVTRDEFTDAATLATAAFVERMRAELDFTIPEGLPADMVQACVELATLQYQQRNAPSGFPGFGETGDGFAGAGGYAGADVYRVAQLYRRIGIRNARTA